MNMRKGRISCDKGSLWVMKRVSVRTLGCKQQKLKSSQFQQKLELKVVIQLNSTNWEFLEWSWFQL